MSIRSRYEFFWGRPAAELIWKFYSSLHSHQGVGATGLMKWTWLFHILEAWNRRHWDTGTKVVHSLSWHIVLLDDKEFTTSLIVLKARPWPRASSRPGLGLEHPQGHHLEVLVLASDGQVLALDRGQGQDLSKTWEKSCTFSNPCVFSNNWVLSC